MMEQLTLTLMYIEGRYVDDTGRLPRYLLPGYYDTQTLLLCRRSISICSTSAPLSSTHLRYLACLR